MAEALAAHGAHVIVNARNEAAVAAAADRIGGKPLAFDVNDGSATLVAMAEIEARHGRLDILINNVAAEVAPRAGHRSGPTRISSGGGDQLHRLLPPCPRGGAPPRRSGRPSRPARLARSAGSTIHGYIAAKAGLHGITRSLAAELGRTGSR